MIAKAKWIVIFYMIILNVSYSQVSAAEPNWVWYYSNNKVSDFYNPESLKVIRDYNGNIDHAEVWMRTTYSQEGKEDIIDNYDLKNKPRIYELTYSLSKVYIYPSKHRILYQNEVFYDNDGKVLWSEELPTSDRGAEVEVDSVNERYFSIVSDLAFRGGQQIYFEKWKIGKDRWIYLDGDKNSDGTIERRWADKLLMSIENNNQISVWVSTKTELNDTLIKVDHTKWIIDVSTNKIKVERTSSWKKGKGWYVSNKYTPSEWQSLVPGSRGEYWFETIKKYADEHRTEIINDMHVK